MAKGDRLDAQQRSRWEQRQQSQGVQKGRTKVPVPVAPPANPFQRTAPNGLCANCEKRPGTVQWIGGGGALDFAHGFYKMWCEICATEAQLAFAKDRAAVIPTLEANLAALLEAERQAT